MPNWCDNKLTVKGSGEEMARFVERAKTTLGANKSLCSWYPLPDDAHKEVTWENKDGEPMTFTAFSDTGYQTALDMWGTKWGDCDTVINNEEENEIEFRYQTAWANADRLIARMSEEYPSLVFVEVFQETGMCFCGYGVYKAGVTIATESEDMEYPEYGDDMTAEEEEAYWDKQVQVEGEAWDDMENRAFEWVHGVMA